MKVNAGRWREMHDVNCVIIIKRQTRTRTYVHNQCHMIEVYGWRMYVYVRLLRNEEIGEI